MSESTSHPLGRRHLLGLGAATAAGGALAAQVAAAAPAGASARRDLCFADDGTFRVVQFNDTQDNHRTDVRTIQLMERVLDREQPGFALVNGDVVNGDMSTAEQVRQAYNHVVLPMEERGIPWAVTFGNHDEDSVAATGMTERRIREFLSGYRHYVGTTARGVTGDSNQVLTLRAARGRGPAFALWLLDSGRYSPETIAGQEVEEYTYETIHADQVAWYREQSQALERKAGAPVPALMFFHIPLWEHRFMWFGSPTEWTDEAHAAAVVKHGIVGERNEREYTAQFNPGLFHAALERGDVKGVFCGHDHINTYVGNYFGIQLGYGPGTGFGTYGLGGDDEHRLRGARVFDLDLDHPGVLKSTRTVFAADLGIDLTPEPQPLETPKPLGHR
ncbi:metallophosphoesterase family protein [Paenibacillus sp. TRM 82003]|uniref:metallophosphoesterase family protein n=1 Tax=Kineococcus sp. TRM81007 TaxID=2925831 RepID=UPI001F5A4B88|nr:metallophosphoesterase family protein [Kineococcus sp. TRM81007]MCI2238168.1 metallophosphoesterase family protein [Kineococcus sp. TRM81007]MCI3920552.1 metallophosphoesterase family protein [Paenibacillus sp. TRM 82003]